MTHPTQEDDVKVNDIACLRINYDVEGWRKLTKGFTLPTVLPGAILAIDSLCVEVEQLRARLEQAERDAAMAPRLFASLDGVVGLAVLGAAKITNYKAAIQDAQALISEYRTVNSMPAIEPVAQEPFDWTAHEYQG